MTKLVTIIGGSGFLGRYIARRMAQAGWRVRVATRRPDQNLQVRTYGVVGQVEPVLCNIRDEASLRAVMAGADAVVNCAGILAERRKNTFTAIQSEGAERVARLAAEGGVAHLVQVSAIGASATSGSDYARSKAAGEEKVKAAFPGAVILRPSIMFGPEDQFFNRFAGMTRLSPYLLIAHADTLFQPVYVDDVAKVAALAAQGEVAAGTYELGGPDVRSFRDLMVMMLDEIRRKRVILNLPRVLARFMATMLELAQVLTAGLFTNKVLTRDQLLNLAHDNVVADGAKGFADLGIQPVPMELVVPEYLWRFRPQGQYTAIGESAKQMRRHT